MRPMLHFLLLGALLFAAREGLAPHRGEPEPVVVSASDLERALHEWRARSGHPPGEAERAAAVQQIVDEELLVRHAVSLGWHRSDPVVQRRMVQNLRFLGAGTEEDDAALLERARDLGMDRTDVVVRRRLVERTRLALAERARRETADDAELARFLLEHSERFARPALVRISHVFLSRDRRGDRVEPDALRLLEELVASEVPPDRAGEHGDPPPLPARLPSWPETRLAARLGPDFGRALAELPEGRWSGPAPSSYGLHLVWIHERVPGHLPPLEAVRREVVAAWRAERERELLAAHLLELRAGVPVRVEGPAPLARPAES
jgi:hypothetical protein